MKVGYVRVSSVELDEVFEEKVSAKDGDRIELKKCLQFLRKKTRFLFIQFAG